MSETKDCHFGKCLGTSLSPNCPCDYRDESLDTADTLKVSGEVTFVGEENPTAPGLPLEETAGVAPYGRESVQGKDEQGEDFFRWLMESNSPPPGIGAHNKDWLGVE